MDLLATTITAKTNAMQFQPVDHFPGQQDLLAWCQGMAIGTGFLFVIMGVVYLLYGYTMFKPLITLNAAIVGAYVGAAIGYRNGYPVACGALGALVAGGATLTVMKWAVAVIGGICGAFFGAALWRTAGLETTYAWAGAMTGLVGFGMFSFILFRGSIIMYTSLQGAMMLILGLLGLAFKLQEMGPQVSQTMVGQPLVLPIAVFIPAILGLIFQQTHSTPTPAGGAAAAPAKK
jgi:hypothetical protein